MKAVENRERIKAGAGPKPVPQRAADATPVPSESVEQQRLFLWARMQSGKDPCLTLMYHIPNEGKRSRATGGRLRAEGLKAGVPDICLPVACGGCHGLYIELKRQHGGRLLPAQAEWMEKLKAQGYQVALCHGWEAASEIILEYLKGGTDA